jgi:DNA modification methylase
LRPYYQHGGITIYHGDCKEILPEVYFGTELILTDPPYGLGQRWTGGTWATNPIYDDALVWDAKAVDGDVIDLVLECAPNVILWGGNYYRLPPTRCWLLWRKPQQMHTMADFEMAWTNFDRPAKAFDELRNPDGTREHPTQKPLSLMKWCLSLAPNATKILDPFCGSGTTLVAAKDVGASAIGIEINERYCEIAAKRLAQEVLPL